MKSLNLLLIILIYCILIVIAGCARQRVTETKPTINLVADELPRIATFDKNEISNWKLVQPVKIYDKKTIFDYIDGAAELYFAYDFKEVAVAEYQNSQTSIIIDVYDMTLSENAFGIYSLNRSQDANYTNIGNEGILAGSALDSWKGKYFCKVYSYDMSGKYQKDVIEFGNKLASRIQEMGEEPSVLKKLPQDGMIPKSAKFFSRKLGLDNIHFVADENVFNLDGETKGAVAEYWLNNTKLNLFIIEYSSQEKANLAFEAYSKYLGEKGEPESIESESKMFEVDGKFTFVKVKDRTLLGFWDAETREIAKSALQYMK